MIIPQYWAEGRIQHRNTGKQITVRRFGWSDIGQAEAQAHADQRTEQALQRLLSGEKLIRREPKIPYNGADGVPIREEILDRRGEAILTRNSYGASCLNTPDVFFADIDSDEDRLRFRISTCIFLLLLCLLGAASWLGISKIIPIAATFSFFFLANKISRSTLHLIQTLRGGASEILKSKIRTFLKTHPDWNFRIYRTPAGFRVLATHQSFSPNDPVVAECFKALGTDRLYSRMCFNQQCFRARVSPKPWRIGMPNHLRPRPGTWPVKAEHLPNRTAWIAEYNAIAKAFSSCQLLESIGSGVTHPKILPCIEWHDELSKANSVLPIA